MKERYRTNFGRPPSTLGEMENPAVFFRSLSTMVGVGIPIHEAFFLLGESSEDPKTQEMASRIGSKLSAGRPLSSSLKDFPQAFSNYQVGLIRVGEQTGSLAQILSTLAEHLEKSQELQFKLKSSVTYPALLVLGSLLMMMLGPSWLLEGQLQMLQQSGMELPHLTKVMIAWTEFCSSPLSLIGLGFLLFGLSWGFRRPDWRRWIYREAHRIPVLQKFLRLSTTARFARAFEISLKSGLPALSALPLSAQVTANPLLIERMEVAKQELVAGASLASSVKAAAYFDSSFCALLESGEEAGKLPAMLQLSANFADLELDLALRQATVLLEPLLLSALGIFTALVLVATLQPTIALLRVL